MLKRLFVVAPSVFVIFAVSSCKREKSDAPLPPDPLTPPAQSAPSATELAPVIQPTDTTTPVGSTAPPPKDQGGGSGTAKKSEKKEEKKEEEKKEEKKEEEKSENKGCFNQCQSAFMTCMTPKTGSGGFPQPPDPETCRKSLENCQSSCK